MPAAFAAAGLAPDSVDVVLMNPPFNDSARHRASPDQARVSAHVATAATLESWVHASRRILKSGGVLSLIWRADGLAEVLAALDRGFGSLKILPVHGEAATPAIRVLVCATKGGKAPAQIHAALVLNDESALPNKQVQEILAGKGVLPLAIPVMPARIACEAKLLRKRFRPLFRRRSEVNRRQKGTDNRHQQIDFHVILRCALAAHNHDNAKGVPSVH